MKTLRNQSRQNYAKGWVLFASLLTIFGGCRGTGGNTVWQEISQRIVADSHRLVRSESAPVVERDGLVSLVNAEQPTAAKMTAARSLEKSDEIDRAIEAYQEIVDVDPQNGEAWHRLAVLHDKKGLHSDAHRYYQEAMHRILHSPDLHADLGYSYYLQQRWEEAEECYREAIRLDPWLARAHNNLGLLLARVHRQEEARSEFKLAGCSEEEAQTNLVHALVLSNQLGEAQRHCERVLADARLSNEVRAELTDVQLWLATQVEHELESPVFVDFQLAEPTASQPNDSVIRVVDASFFLETPVSRTRDEPSPAALAPTPSHCSWLSEPTTAGRDRESQD